MSAQTTDNQNHLTLQLIKINPKNKLKNTQSYDLIRSQIQMVTLS